MKRDQFSPDFPWPIGNVIDIKTENNSVRVISVAGETLYTPYSEDIVRISVSQISSVTTEVSPAVVFSPRADLCFTVKRKSEITLSLSNLTVIVDPANSSFTIKRKGKEVINMEKLSFHQLNGWQFLHFKPQAGEKVVGLGEKVGGVNRVGKFFRHENTDAFGYSPETDPLYSSIPFFMGIHSEVYGIYLDNSEISHFDFLCSQNRSYAVSAQAQQLNIFFFSGDSLRDILSGYTSLTGRMPLPPRWSLGFQQSRYSYSPQSAVEEMVTGMKNRGIPIDAVHLDIHYMGGYKAFTADKKRFPNLKKFSDKFKKMGIHLVFVVDPGIKVEKGYPPYEDGIKHGYFVKYPDGEGYQGGVWPGQSHFPDFTQTRVRKWWGELSRFYWENGAAGIWNDMNEPAVWGQKFPPYILFDFDEHPASLNRARNIYGNLMNEATADSHKKFFPNRRGFILTRAAFAGVQRTAAKWTGDNVANDEHFLLGVRLVNSLGMAGVAFAGVDVGGFVGETSPRLYARWIMTGAFFPFFRAHKMINSHSSEPWDFGEEITAVAVNFIRLRYRLFPYLYQAFLAAHRTGIPVNRMMALDHYREKEVFLTEYENQFFHGENLLVCPVDSQTKYLEMYLPPVSGAGGWYHLFTDELREGGQELGMKVRDEYLPVWVKGNSILFLQKIVPNLSEPVTELEVHLYPWSSDPVPLVSEYYEDDGISHDYLKGKSVVNQVVYNPQAGEFSFISETAQKTYLSQLRKIRLYLHGNLNFSKVKINCNGKVFEKKWRRSDYVWLERVPNFDPFMNKENPDIQVPVLTTEFDFT